MTNTFKTLIAASALIAFSGTAFAGETTSTTFTYDSSAPVEVTYERFQDIAEQACEIDLRDAGGIVAKTRMENICRVELVSDAVKATKTNVLIAFHDQQLEAEAENVKIASLGQENSSN